MPPRFKPFSYSLANQGMRNTNRNIAGLHKPKEDFTSPIGPGFQPDQDPVGVINNPTGQGNYLNPPGEGSYLNPSWTNKELMQSFNPFPERPYTPDFGPGSSVVGGDGLSDSLIDSEMNVINPWEPDYTGDEFGGSNFDEWLESWMLSQAEEAGWQEGFGEASPYENYQQFLLGEGTLGDNWSSWEDLIEAWGATDIVQSYYQNWLTEQAGNQPGGQTGEAGGMGQTGGGIGEGQEYWTGPIAPGTGTGGGGYTGPIVGDEEEYIEGLMEGGSGYIMPTGWETFDSEQAKIQPSKAGKAAKKLYYPGTSGGFASTGSGITSSTIEELIKQMQG